MFKFIFVGEICKILYNLIVCKQKNIRHLAKVCEQTFFLFCNCLQNNCNYLIWTNFYVKDKRFCHVFVKNSFLLLLIYLTICFFSLCKKN